MDDGYRVIIISLNIIIFLIILFLMIIIFLIICPQGGRVLDAATGMVARLTRFLSETRVGIILLLFLFLFDQNFFFF